MLKLYIGMVIGATFATVILAIFMINKEED